MGLLLGGTVGGITYGVEGHSALVEWRCLVPRMFSDSSAAAELVMATIATKSILGFRMLLTELRMLHDGPTTLYVDAKTVIGGAEMERVTKQMRFMAARYSMLRSAIASKKIKLHKVESSLNKADIFTKPLVREDFERARALVLGLDM